MRGNTKAHVKKFASQLSKFTARWNQLKPKNIDLEGDALVSTYSALLLFYSEQKIIKILFHVYYMGHGL